MDNDKINKVGFALAKITTEQFAVFESNFNKAINPRLKLNFKFAADPVKKLVGVFAYFIFECEEKPFIVIEAGCHFNIQPDSWNELLNDQHNSLTIPQKLMQHLAVITVGTTRGILHAKTENTKFNRFHLPTINLAEIITEDKVFNLENNE
ncbi:hypothetical protein [Marinilabilia salmonicolor]|jgi:hypothetical protein|uniref:Uncharacterized protein n=1 Tax=Marinilabilia salmonicolor TaxID=989 RepID=A0A368UWV7_9BACT|nr:hypothetical protein [Marinilabilia salmonicolor]RCW31371.1 hypothetical protein DFO77_11888 [Marinilabilia salmonicolor]